MSRLVIDHFSCIEEGSVDIKKMTFLIGPQASGKSVISKLIYFFNDILDEQFSALEEDMTYRQFHRRLIENFKKAFPSAAWGNNAFQIEYHLGPYLFILKRGRVRKNSSGTMTLSISDNFQDNYERYLNEIRTLKLRTAEKNDESFTSREWEIFYDVRRKAVQAMRHELGNDYYSSQLFIPAGRSFFTSMGKAVVAFEQGGYLDPATAQFGRYFTTMRDMLLGRGFVYRSRPPNKERIAHRTALAAKLFGGTIKSERNEAYVEAEDGRKIAFSILSSGQQELLPLWLALNEFMNDESDNVFLYIEEPEAHLFPSAQSVLAEYLATLVNFGSHRGMFITTHSPYILAKINNLLRAGDLGRAQRRKYSAQVDKVIPRNAWLNSGQFAAYAIEQKTVVSVLGDDGLVDGDYLDRVSSDISEEFSDLLMIEAQNV
ncbi:hypothetical protein SLNSH_21000 [Alsobacter soli]|uniref:Endonuclease GajA/Old nuclease/RecF-like AAA domain-containing protein n=1 Tax=Alsobacter soli TaxID=2109933 RepID=A0A2T1HMY2_9HYPH|nr:AAA family ATPase [Alsobacter soli]PSC02992.1 hypothetical protein SLNSH_21000 [Alsobacter soli]